MNGRDSWCVVGLSLFAGVSGGMASSWLFATKPVLAQKAPPPTSPKVLRVERLELVDKRGNVRGVLEVLPSGTPRLLLGDNPTKSVWINDESVAIGDMNNGGAAVILGRLSQEGGWGASIYEKNSGMVAINPNSIGIRDKWDDVRVGLGNFKDGPGLDLYDRGGSKPRVILGVPNGVGSLVVLDRDGGVLGSVP